MRIYTGIGSRETPGGVLALMHLLGSELCKDGFTLRSGHAPGADTAFERGCDTVDSTKKEIYLPWRGFEGSDSPYYTVGIDAMDIAKKFHPNWPALRQGGMKLMGRNAYQVLGRTLKVPSNIIICWTVGGLVRGGTGQAIRMATHYNIPILNLGSQSKETLRLDELLALIHKIVDK